MPKKKINDFYFYKIVCKDDTIDLCYVGSTANFRERRYSHKSNCHNENSRAYNFKIYKTIRENGGWDNFKMVEIGKRPQLTYRQAEQIEEEYRQELKSNMNTRKCFIADYKTYMKEYLQSEKGKASKQLSAKKWRDNNKEYHREYQKKWREAKKKNK